MVRTKSLSELGKWLIDWSCLLRHRFTMSSIFLNTKSWWEQVHSPTTSSGSPKNFELQEKPESILGVRWNGEMATNEWLVKWMNLLESEATWESILWRNGFLFSTLRTRWVSKQGYYETQILYMYSQRGNRVIAQGTNEIWTLTKGICYKWEPLRRLRSALMVYDWERRSWLKAEDRRESPALSKVFLCVVHLLLFSFSLLFGLFCGCTFHCDCELALEFLLELDDIVTGIIFPYFCLSLLGFTECREIRNLTCCVRVNLAIFFAQRTSYSSFQVDHTMVW